MLSKHINDILYINKSIYNIKYMKYIFSIIKYKTNYEKKLTALFSLLAPSTLLKLKLRELEIEKAELKYR